MMRAVVVLPTPRTPVRIQACGIRLVSNAFETVRTMASWPIRPLKLEGRYLRASTRYGFATSTGPPRSKPPCSVWSSGGAPASVIGRSAIECLSGPACGKEPNHAQQAGAPHDLRDSLGKTGRRLTSDPIRTSLGLLPSGPDPVGEWLRPPHPPPPP